MNRPAQRATKEERALTLLTLLNPMHEDACCVLGMHVLLDKLLFHKALEDDSRHGPFLRAAMTFLSTKRSPGERHVLRERLTRRHCKHSIRSRLNHRPVTRPLTEIFELVLLDICGAITDYFMRLGPGKLRKEKPNVSQDAQPWPSRVSDVIPTPGGERERLEALVQWAATAPGGHSVFTLVGALARFWEPFAHLRCALDSYSPHATRGVQMYVFISPVIACAGLFFAIMEIDMTATISRLAPIYEEMYTIAVAIEPILLRIKDMDDHRRWFKFVRQLRAVIKPDGTFITVAEASALPGERDFRVHFGGAFLRMVEIRNHNKARFLPLPLGLALLTDATSLSACTSAAVRKSKRALPSARVVELSGFAVLRAAWDATDLSHRVLCKQIKALRTGMGLLDDKVWNHTMRHSIIHRLPEEFIQICVARNVDQGIAEAIFRGVNLLTQAKSRFAANEDQMRQLAIDPAPSEESAAVEAPTEASRHGE
ncbi:hypothetical protein DFH09DRAFT_1317887 [Mycena vulgaris]|nr:hypothetical protein DFH09DRAFT_1317887 [Mycena vulgaris]